MTAKESVLIKKDDIVKVIVDSIPRASLNKLEGDKIYNSIIQYMFDGLKNGYSIRLLGIGTLSPTVRQESVYRNPRTRELVTKPAHKRIKFSMSKNIKNDINEQT